MVEWLGALQGLVRAVYGAGPTGFRLYRAATAARIEVAVIAPSKTPRAPGDRVKTDRKDLQARAVARYGGTRTLAPVMWILARCRACVRACSNPYRGVPCAAPNNRDR